MRFQEPSGINFRPAMPILIKEMEDTLPLIWRFVSAKDPSPILLRYEDWWQHDGLHFEKGKITREVFSKMIGSKGEIIKSMSGDFNVRIGIASPKMEWYLRYYVAIEEDILDGYYDVTVPLTWENEFEAEVGMSLKTPFVKEDAEGFYKAIKQK